MTARPMKICLVDPHGLLPPAFEKLGHEVLRIVTGNVPIFDLQQALAAHDFEPDLLLQMEWLGTRTLLTGLEKVECPVVFWALDPHLNGGWHAPYARLFDLVLSTQGAWIPDLEACGAPDVRHLPWYGHEREWVPWAERSHDITFVGRVTAQRPARQWMIEFLEESMTGYDLAITQDIAFDDMLDLYADSKLAPNECILSEVNFRIFEAASCGCLLLTPDLGDEQNSLFEPNREIAVYDNVADMGSTMMSLLRDQKRAEAMARAGWDRIQAEHLPEHRARSIISMAEQCARNRVTGSEAGKYFHLALAKLSEYGLMDLGQQKLADDLGKWDDPKVLAARAGLYFRLGDHEKLRALVMTVLSAEDRAFESDLAAGMAALKLDSLDSDRDMLDASRALLFRIHQRDGGPAATPPDTAYQLLGLWSRLLAHHGFVVRAGKGYEPEACLPVTALECLYDILDKVPEDLATLRRVEVLTRDLRGLESVRLGYLSTLTLHERNDWRMGLQTGLTALRVYRLSEGMEEIELAGKLAVEQGQERFFHKALKAYDKDGVIAALLGKTA